MGTSFVFVSLPGNVFFSAYTYPDSSLCVFLALIRPQAKLIPPKKSRQTILLLPSCCAFSEAGFQIISY